MNTILTKIAACCLFLLLATQTQAETRAWSNRDGKIIQADLVSYDAEKKTVTLKLANGSQPTLALDTLSDADKTWLSGHQKESEERAKTLSANAGKTVSYKSEGSGAVTYHAYYPTNFNGEAPPAMIIMFSPGGSGKGILDSVKEACEALGWVGVGCDVFRNGGDDAELDEKWNEVLPHIEKTVLHNPDLLYMGGMSGGAARAYAYSEWTVRPWKGILAFGGWLSDRETLHCAPKMVVAIVNGDNDRNANLCIPRDVKVLKKERCKVETFSFPGGHVVAPPATTLEAMRWMQANTVPGNRLSGGKKSPAHGDPKDRKAK